MPGCCFLIGCVCSFLASNQVSQAPWGAIDYRSFSSSAGSRLDSVISAGKRLETHGNDFDRIYSHRLWTAQYQYVEKQSWYISYYPCHVIIPVKFAIGIYGEDHLGKQTLNLYKRTAHYYVWDRVLQTSLPVSSEVESFSSFHNSNYLSGNTCYQDMVYEVEIGCMAVYSIPEPPTVLGFLLSMMWLRKRRIYHSRPITSIAVPAG
jgi:hypothetical protein